MSVIKFLYFCPTYTSEFTTTYLGGDAIELPGLWGNLKNPFLRNLCRLHLSPKINDKIKLPFRSIWNHIVLKNKFPGEEDVCLIMSSHYFRYIDIGTLDYFVRKHKNARLVFEFSDRYDFFRKKYKGFPSAEELLKRFDLVVSYNVEDCKKYGFTRQRPRFPVFQQTEGANAMESDVFFVGWNKGRLRLLYDIYDKCVKKGLKCDFHIIGVSEEEKRDCEGIVYNQPIPYSEVLERVKRTKCVINLIQEGGAGITMREYEALTYKKMLLTNNYGLLDSPVYLKENVIWLDDFDDDIDRIITGAPREFDCNEYSNERWYEWLNKTLCHKKQQFIDSN